MSRTHGLRFGQVFRDWLDQGQDTAPKGRQDAHFGPGVSRQRILLHNSFNITCKTHFCGDFHCQKTKEKNISQDEGVSSHGASHEQSLALSQFNLGPHYFAPPPRNLQVNFMGGVTIYL